MNRKSIKNVEKQALPYQKHLYSGGHKGRPKAYSVCLNKICSFKSFRAAHIGVYEKCHCFRRG